MKRTAERRQTAEEELCYVGNDVLACYPNEGDTFVQDQYGRLVWNRNYPEFTNENGFIDVYLFHEDNDSLVRSWLHVENAKGRIAFMPTDSWWQGREAADNFNGTDISWPYYFVITYAGRGLRGSLPRLATWSAIQTALPAQVAAARASASASIASASAAVAPTPTPTSVLSNVALMESSMFAGSLTSALMASLSAANATGTQLAQATATTTFLDGLIATATATVQANGRLPGPANEKNGKSEFPDWAIALIVVLGLFTLIAFVIAWYFCLAAVRRRSGRGERHFPSDQMSQIGSNTPIFGDRTTDRQSESSALADPISPKMAEASSFATRDVAPVDVHSPLHASREVDVPEDIMMRDKAEGLTSKEAWRLANAFREVLRRPRISARFSLVDGQNDSSSHDRTVNSPASPVGSSARVLRPLDDDNFRNNDADDYDVVDALLRAELAGEGHELRSVSEVKRPEYHAPPSS